MRARPLRPNRRQFLAATAAATVFAHIPNAFAAGYDLITGVSKKIKGLTVPHWYEFDIFPVSKG